MNNNPVYWKGQELPPKKSGHVYVIRMWPGGRDDVDFVIASLPDNHPVKRKVKG